MIAIRLEPIAPETYIRTVLPETYALWGAKRTFDKYVEDFREMATSTYAKRRDFTIGIYEDGELAASCKTYDRELRWNQTSLRAVGIGAVFTPPQYRGRGYATAMLGAFLDAEREAGRDVAFLFSDIHPEFYARLGFIALPSRLITLRAASLGDERVTAAPLETRDWPGIRRCFESPRPRAPVVAAPHAAGLGLDAATLERARSGGSAGRAPRGAARSWHRRIRDRTPRSKTGSFRDRRFRIRRRRRTRGDRPALTGGGGRSAPRLGLAPAADRTRRLARGFQPRAQGRNLHGSTALGNRSRVVVRNERRDAYQPRRPVWDGDHV